MRAATVDAVLKLEAENSTGVVSAVAALLAHADRKMRLAALNVLANITTSRQDRRFSFSGRSRSRPHGSVPNTFWSADPNYHRVELDHLELRSGGTRGRDETEWLMDVGAIVAVAELAEDADEQVLPRAEADAAGGIGVLRPANFRGLVLGCIEANFFQVNMRLKAGAEIYIMHSFALL